MNSQKEKQEGEGSSSTTLATTSESDDEDEEAYTSSSDAIYGEKLEEKSDLMKSMLRHTYNQEANRGGRRNGVTRDLEGGVREEERFGGSDGSVDDPRILFHGPPGCRKTKLAHDIADETRVPFYKLSAIELVSGVSGASEENIRELFSKAYRTAPSIVFIDEIDAVPSKTENLQKEMEQHIVTQLLTCMDESHRVVKPNDAEELIGATNRPDAIDPTLRRPGRFDHEIALGIPDENAMAQILSVLTRNLRVEGAFDVMKIASLTPGFVGADLAALTNKEGNLAMKRIIDMRKVELLGELADGEDAEE
ncbi:Nuclear valosin-containing protein-like [Capsicum baccatum]|uniref:Nuclear valosin-containing protein-like n=1 Tax=Capsicum baccatum TaxID=33114 RepID=A0A2G2X3Z6_CAPBA|nr:Nuclear valosin-containing protein-like [Capsicum baccatum]